MITSSPLRQLLDLFEENQEGKSIQSLAVDLGLHPARVESMLEYWLRKGKIRVSSAAVDCGSCSALGNCPFVVKTPVTYELVESDLEEIHLPLEPGCK